MNDSKNILIEIIEALNLAKVNYIIAGGVAVVLQGVERLTMDLDTAVSLEKENVQKFIDVMKTLGLIPRLPVDAKALLDIDQIKFMVEEKNALVFTFIDPKNPTRQVDFFMLQDLSYESLKNHVEEMDLGNQKINVLTKQKLVELKLKVNPMRDKDLFDIRELQKLILNEKK
jgi:hypothetical protein